jgi:dihydroceramidase
MAQAAAAAAGVWGEPTATLDWCEENYAASPLVAELWNTLSNVWIALPAVYGAVLAWRHRLEGRFRAAFVALALVGLGSSVFHMTLQYAGQLLDELPMIYAACISIFCIADYPWSAMRPHWPASAPLLAMLAFYATVVTVVYLLWTEVLFHQVAYGLLVVLLVGLARRRARVSRVPGVPRLYTLSLAFFGTAWFLWNVDNYACAWLVQQRARLPWFMAPFLQLHAWWHFGVGIGSYLHILLSLLCRLEHLGSAPRLRWPGIFLGLVALPIPASFPPPPPRSGGPFHKAH